MKYKQKPFFRQNEREEKTNIKTKVTLNRKL